MWPQWSNAASVACCTRPAIASCRANGLHVLTPTDQRRAADGLQHGGCVRSGQERIHLAPVRVEALALDHGQDLVDERRVVKAVRVDHPAHPVAAHGSHAVRARDRDEASPFPGLVVAGGSRGARLVAGVEQREAHHPDRRKARDLERHAAAHRVTHDAHGPGRRGEGDLRHAVVIESADR